MAKNLVIVESPAKAKTIEKFLGEDYMVKSSYGHVRDLPKDDSAIDIENNFKPVYQISADKKSVVSELKKDSKGAEIVWLATDDDREGEAISWHLKEALGLKDQSTKRIVFREITKKAIVSAIDSPREIDYDLVNAQQARRILDRLVGFELSPVLWKKIRRGLSAGRVQSVAVRLVVERERAISSFESESSFKVSAVFTLGDVALEMQLPKRLGTTEEVEAFLTSCKGKDFSVIDLQKKKGKRSASAPFTTSTLQQEASNKLGFSVTQTMVLAQKLYEAGHISYMRTDSVALSDEAIEGAKQSVINMFGEEYSNPKVFKNKNKSAQEAHEAIRPTNFSVPEAGEDDGQMRLYKLIWARTMASQMSDAILDKTVVQVSAEGIGGAFEALGEILTFDGFLKVYTYDKGKNKTLPPLSIGDVAVPKIIEALERFSKHPPRYTEASLVRELEEKGIGRPSTYAPTISTVQKRNYVVKDTREGEERTCLYWKLDLGGEVEKGEQKEMFGAEKNKLFPTSTGMVVNDFLVNYFPNVVDFSFTAKVEEQFDQIAHGTVAWEAMLKDFYTEFHKKVEDTEQNVDRSEVGTVVELGVDPASGKNIYVKLGKFGPYAQKGENDDEDKVSASLRKGQLLETLKLEEALELFKLPRQLGTFEDKVVVAAIGRFGPYVRHDGKFVSLGKELDPHTVELETAIELILAKREADAKKLIKVFDEDPEVRILNGRWGPYISYQKKNYKIPKDKEATELTFDQCMEYIKNPPPPARKKKKKAE